MGGRRLQGVRTIRKLQDLDDQKVAATALNDVAD